MKDLHYEYTILKENDIKEERRELIKSTDKPPICFWAGSQPLVTILWAQKERLIKRVEELEAQL